MKSSRLWKVTTKNVGNLLQHARGGWATRKLADISLDLDFNINLKWSPVIESCSLNGPTDQTTQRAGDFLWGFPGPLGI